MTPPIVIKFLTQNTYFLPKQLTHISANNPTTGQRKKQQASLLIFLIHY